MNWLFLLDVLLFVLGLLTLSPRLLGRSKRTAAVLAFYLGFAMIAAAGVAVGLVEWEKARRPKSSDLGAAFEKRLAAHRSGEALARKKAIGPVEAPDFSLSSLDEGHSVRLSDFRGHKPVVLIFGSFG
jgi:hypothetical protein